MRLYCRHATSFFVDTLLWALIYFGADMYTRLLIKTVLFTPLFMVGCGDTSSAPNHSVIQKNDVEIQNNQAKLRHTFPDVVLIGRGAESPSLKVFSPIEILPGKSYTLTFSAQTSDLAAGETLFVDLFPDNLPEKSFVVSPDKTEYQWKIFTNEPEADGAKIRFFSRFPIDEEISVKEIIILED